MFVYLFDCAKPYISVESETHMRRGSRSRDVCNSVIVYINIDIIGITLLAFHTARKVSKSNFNSQHWTQTISYLYKCNPWPKTLESICLMKINFLWKYLLRQRVLCSTSIFNKHIKSKHINYNRLIQTQWMTCNCEHNYLQLSNYVLKIVMHDDGLLSKSWFPFVVESSK
jgi:hypothetical protein